VGVNKAIKTKHFPQADDADIQFHTKLLGGYQQMPPLSSKFQPWLTNALNFHFEKIGE
jgi:hypothetical protein